MKIKVTPTDFIVREVITYRLEKAGPYQIYELEKWGWDTFDLFEYLSRRYHLKNISRAGIKDRYSYSYQIISTKGKLISEITEKNFRLKFLGYASSPITPRNLIGNQFTITIRDLTSKEIEKIMANLSLVKKYGFLNYYDEQRMGSARAGKGFIGELLVKRHYNGALKLYLATPSPFDNNKMRKLKKHLNNYWGNWEMCLKEGYNEHHFRRILLYLKDHSSDFKGAIKRIDRELLEMFINSYQAYIFNETIKELLKSLNIKFFVVRYRLGELYFYSMLDEKNFNYLKNLMIPSASYKSSFEDEKLKNIMQTVLERYGLSLEKLKLDLGIKGIFFKPYLRKILVFPENLEVNTPLPDECYPNKYKLNLSFFLPKGSYATILLKRVGYLGL